MKNKQTLDELCHGQFIFYDINKSAKCGNKLKYKSITCEYLDNTFCLNEFETKTIFKYTKK